MCGTKILGRYFERKKKKESINTFGRLFIDKLCNAIIIG